jgi:cyclin B
MGGSMTTAGADVDMRESYSSYLERSASEDMTDALPDIDLYDHDNPLCVTQYVNDIYQYWYKVEPETQVSETYMLIQGDINSKMRAILIDWLVEVHLKFKLMPETLFLTTNLIDRFLELKTVTRKNLQLVGVTAMLVASKYEEIWAPEVRDFVYISDRAYTRQQILEMEKQMLNALGFHLTVPTPYQFMNRFFKAAGGDRKFQLYASYAVECALPDYNMLQYPGSTLAAAGVYIAMRGLRTGSWNHVMEAHTRLSEAEVYPCACDMAELMRKAPTASLTAVYKKYSSEKFMKIASLPVPHDLRL